VIAADHGTRPRRSPLGTQDPGTTVRVIRGAGSLPTLDTLIDLIDAIGLELDIQIKRQPRRRESDYSPLKIRSTV
jgi:hypothetical protein